MPLCADNTRTQYGGAAPHQASGHHTAAPNRLWRCMSTNQPIRGILYALPGGERAHLSHSGPLYVLQMMPPQATCGIIPPMATSQPYLSPSLQGGGPFPMVRLMTLPCRAFDPYPSSAADLILTLLVSSLALHSTVPQHTQLPLWQCSASLMPSLAGMGTWGGPISASQVRTQYHGMSDSDSLLESHLCMYLCTVPAIH